MRRLSPLRAVLLVALLIAVAAPAVAAAGESLSLRDARGQIRTATQTWADLVDGRAYIGRCDRMRASVIRCTVVIRSATTRCEMRVSVARGAKWDSVRARGVRCQSS